MNVRAALAVFTLAGLPAIAQERVNYSLDWYEVVANTSTPVASPNGVLEPGEGARLAVTVTISPGVGSVATYVPPPWPGSGTIAGLGSIHFDLFGTNALGGTWSAIRRDPGGVSWALGGQGQGQPNGDLLAAQAGQFLAQGAVANSTNPVAHIWTGTWTPATYALRTASFLCLPNGGETGNHSAFLIKYGEGPLSEPLYIARFVGGDSDSSGAIPIVPAPGALALLAVVVFVGRRGR